MEEVEHDMLVSCLSTLHTCCTLRHRNELFCSSLLISEGAGRDGKENGEGWGSGRMEDGRSG